MTVETIPVIFNTTGAEALTFGRLEWRGGVEILSDDPEFGGYSGLIVSPDGLNMLAVSDKGRWLSASIVYENGVLTSVADAATAPVLGTGGSPLSGKDRQDAEGLAPAGPMGFDGTVYMALEREERILRFDFGRRGFAAIPRLIALPDEAARGPFNKELEAVAVLSQGNGAEQSLIAISERFLDDAGNIRGWIIGGASSGAIAITRSDDYDVTDLATLPNGDLLMLERRLSNLMLAGMRIRRIRLSDVAPGVTLEGEVLLEANQPRATIDNMEAIAVHRTVMGEIRLTLMSDDNFNPLQRTLLLQFALSQ